MTGAVGAVAQPCQGPLGPPCCGHAETAALGRSPAPQQEREMEGVALEARARERKRGMEARESGAMANIFQDTHADKRDERLVIFSKAGMQTV